ncbi:hypothetical protein ACX03_20400 [Vibrio parahaemolyticus]|nr:hypothetical protein ACX03_20400 [Vibrio parahaemolyticus]
MLVLTLIEILKHRYAFRLYIVLALMYVIAPSVVFLNGFFGLSFTPPILELARDVEKYQFAYLGAFSAFAWLMAFLFGISEKDYRLHDLAGIIGVGASLASLSAMAFAEHKILAAAFAVSGFLCVYCISVPLYIWFQSKLKHKAWEVGFLTLVLGSTFSYILSGYSGILINEFFKVNSSYFSFTKPVAMFLILTPYISIFSFFFIMYVVWVETRKNKSCPDDVNVNQENTQQSPDDVNVNQENTQQSDGVRTFYNINKILACYVILVIAMASGSRASSVIELTSATFDFDPETQCKLDKKYDGYIILDPAHSKVLTYEKDAEKPYIVRDCRIK